MLNVKKQSASAPAAEASADQTAPVASRFATLAIIGSVSIALTACSSIGGTTYGTGKSQESELLKTVTSGFGILGEEEKKEPIDYSARGGLVLPPEGAPMPTPQTSQPASNSVATDWPQDPDKLRKLYHNRLTNMTEQERRALLAEIRKLPKEQRDQIFKNDPASTEFVNQIEEPDYSKHVSPAQAKAYSRQVKERLALIKERNGENSKGRKYLTQPPTRVTQVGPEVQQELDKLATEEQKEEKKGGLRRLWPF